MISIRKNLVILISCILITSTITASIIIFYNSHDEASEVFDANMMQIAQALSYADGESGVISQAREIDDEEEILIQVWNANNGLEYSSPKIRATICSCLGTKFNTLQNNPFAIHTKAIEYLKIFLIMFFCIQFSFFTLAGNDSCMFCRALKSALLQVCSEPNLQFCFYILLVVKPICKFGDVST